MRSLGGGFPRGIFYHIVQEVVSFLVFVSLFSKDDLCDLIVRLLEHTVDQSIALQSKFGSAVVGFLLVIGLIHLVKSDGQLRVVNAQFAGLDLLQIFDIRPLDSIGGFRLSLEIQKVVPGRVRNPMLLLHAIGMLVHLHL